MSEMKVEDSSNLAFKKGMNLKLSNHRCCPVSKAKIESKRNKLLVKLGCSLFAIITLGLLSVTRSLKL